MFYNYGIKWSKSCSFDDKHINYEAKALLYDCKAMV